MKSSLLLLLLLLSFTLLPETPEALVVRIPPGKIKCVTEELESSAISVATYRVAGDLPYKHNMSARVTDMHGDILHLANDIESGQFAFVVKKPGPYSTCFWSPLFKLGGEISVEFEWKTGIAAKGLAKFARKGKIDAVEIELKKLEDSVSSIYEEMRFLREREEEAWKLNDDTNSRMGTLSLLSLAICMGVAGLQLWHLKTFFEREKIL